MRFLGYEMLKNVCNYPNRNINSVIIMFFASIFVVADIRHLKIRALFTTDTPLREANEKSGSYTLFFENGVI